MVTFPLPRFENEISRFLYIFTDNLLHRNQTNQYFLVRYLVQIVRYLGWSENKKYLYCQQRAEALSVELKHLGDRLRKV